MERFFQQSFSFENDYMYAPPNIVDSSKGSAFLVLDINKHYIPAPTAENVPIYCYRISVSGDTMYELNYAL